jgi:hypothetical protein
MEGVADIADECVQKHKGMEAATEAYEAELAAVGLLERYSGELLQKGLQTDIYAARGRMLSALKAPGGPVAIPVVTSSLVDQIRNDQCILSLLSMADGRALGMWTVPEVDSEGRRCIGQGAGLVKRGRCLRALARSAKGSGVLSACLSDEAANAIWRKFHPGPEDADAAPAEKRAVAAG